MAIIFSVDIVFQTGFVLCHLLEWYAHSKHLDTRISIKDIEQETTVITSISEIEVESVNSSVSDIQGSANESLLKELKQEISPEYCEKEVEIQSPNQQKSNLSEIVTGRIIKKTEECALIVSPTTRQWVHIGEKIQHLSLGDRVMVMLDKPGGMTAKEIALLVEQNETVTPSYRQIAN